MEIFLMSIRMSEENKIVGYFGDFWLIYWVCNIFIKMNVPLKI